MNSTGVEGDGTLGAFSVDSTVPGAVPRGFDAFLREWETRIGDGFPQPTYSPATIADFRVKSRVAKVRDVAITDVHGVSAIRTAGNPGGVEDQVRMYVVRRGAWTLGGTRDRAEHTVRGGQFLLRHVGRPSHFETVPPVDRGASQWRRWVAGPNTPSPPTPASREPSGVSRALR